MRHAVHAEDGLGADGGWIEQQVRAQQRHRPRDLREPLIPADADADATYARIKHAKAGVPRRKIKLLLIAVVVRNVRFAIDAEQAAVRVDHRHGVIQAVSVPLEKAHGNHYAEFLRDHLHTQHRRILRNR
ncbi:hypothetical protein SDC9_186211 [bioreactor metagenome]|uniref:Uncharacterized protein n=1 Tax=bioreactor metagenome TaxID=1076179 RepID=A0A645HJB0_9ZZZZ